MCYFILFYLQSDPCWFEHDQTRLHSVRSIIERDKKKTEKKTKSLDGYIVQSIIERE